MDFLLKFFGGAFALVALYLIVTNADKVNTILRSFSASSGNVFSVLQGNRGTLSNSSFL